MMLSLPDACHDTLSTLSMQQGLRMQQGFCVLRLLTMSNAEN